MKIDMQVEPLVRETLHAVVQRDEAKLETALRNLGGPATGKGVELASAVTMFVLIDVYGGKPSADQIAALSAKCAEMEAWAEPSADEVATFVTALVRGTSTEGLLPAESVVVLSFLIAGNLLSSCRKENEKWWDYLDRAEAAIERA